MTSALLQPEVAHPVEVKTGISARRTRAKQYMYLLLLLLFFNIGKTIL